MLTWCSAFRIFTSRSAVIGNPFSSCTVLILLSATISLETLSLATKTLPYVPSPTWCFFSNTSTSRITTGAMIDTFEDLRCFLVLLFCFSGGGGTSFRFCAAGGGGGGLLGGGGGLALVLGGGGGGGRAFGGGGLFPEGGPAGGGGRTIVCDIAIVFMWSPKGAALVGRDATVLV
jgi:hypothetical protein